MPGLHDERTLQNEILRELQARGWVLGEGSKKAGKYDLKRGLYAEDVIAWLTASEAEEYAKVQSMHNGDTEEKVFDRLVKVLEQRGAIDVLRNGFQYVSATFSMCAFPPNSNLNQTERERANRVILRVVPELQYSESNDNRLDLALFVNGIPVATIELKTENTQTIDDAVRQYCLDRPPKDPVTKRPEPLLTWKRGALVHFAVSSREVRMTTKLAGSKTRFLPFNQGNHGGAGNPPETGVNYLWESVLERNTWLNILRNFVCIERKKIQHPNGKIEVRETLLFPRYHQWDAVTKLVDAARIEGVGRRYLIQHSAGSGKSNSIMWLAHRLAHLHDERDDKIFDTVFVLTDRTVLDEQLAEAVQQFEHSSGTIARIDNRGGSKAEQLATALNDRAPIVIVTLQTFPFVMGALQEDAKWKGRSFAIIADEAHSSQTGQSARKIRDVLGLREDEGDVGLDDEIAASLKAGSAERTNLSYFAFTATPKAKTLELFGRPGPDGTPRPFHVYSMRQAIEEHFILDVLQNYTTYKMAYRVATAEGHDYDVPKGEAAKLIARMAKLHSYTIGQKIAIIVEHFRETVAMLLSGHAKAMIVTDSREAAVRYKIQTDAYIKERGYHNLRTLVAFSGEVALKHDFPGAYTETGMNHLEGMRIPTAFETDEYQVLIVAEKYQTGFDQPLLCGMYVDKKLEGLAAVQTLSRLNRTYNGSYGDKETTYILDFVNEAERIREAFLPYYETAELQEVTDPNALHDLIHKIDAYGMPALYTEPDIDRFIEEYEIQRTRDQQHQTRLNNLMAPVCERFMQRLHEAKADGDTQAVDAATIFRKDLQSFVRLFRFLSQLYEYGFDMVGKREVYYDWLARGIRQKETGERPDISAVRLTHLRLSKTFSAMIGLDGTTPLPGITGIGSGTSRPKVIGPLSEVIQLMNEFFGADVSEENRINVVTGIFEKAVKDDDLRAQATNNTKKKFTLGTVQDRINSLLIETYHEETGRNEENNRQMEQIRTILTDEERFGPFARAMANAIYDAIVETDPSPAR